MPLQLQQLDAAPCQALEDALGYLNFSSGAADPRFLANLDRLYRVILDGANEDEPLAPWDHLRHLLLAKLDKLAEAGDAFADARQASETIALVHDRLLPAYRRFHKDLLHHLPDDQLWNSYMLGRAYEAVLQARNRAISEMETVPLDELIRGGEAADDQPDLGGQPSDAMVVQEAIGHLNDFIGYRPVPILETRKVEPYEHERVRPIPVFIRGAGYAAGPYEEILRRAMEILEATDEGLLRQAWFDPRQIEEISLDPRAYDFDHPANKRPNYHFGQWDTRSIDNKGLYRRFVIQRVTIDSLLVRLAEEHDVPRDEILFEAGAALAGTMLMASAVTGNAPNSHASDVTLSTLLPQVASFRDDFYNSLIDRVEAAHGDRLREEMAARRQPFGAVRQHLNAQLARRRASQLELVQIAKLFARMGYRAAAMRKADSVNVPSARTICRIQCRLTGGHLDLEHGRVAAAAAQLPEIIDLLRRGIECGAIVDPWNAIGFDANYSLFPSVENSVRDHRIDELIELVEQIFALYGRAWAHAAAANEAETAERISHEFEELAAWWDRFALTSVSSVEAASARLLYEAAQVAADALAAWRQSGSTAGDIAFWRPYADRFDSPKAYILVLEALLDRRDFVAAMGMLMHWLSQADHIDLQEAGDSFHAVSERWMGQLLSDDAIRDADDASRGDEYRQTITAEERAKLIGKFFAHLEASADEYWQVPSLELDLLLGEAAEDDEDDEDDDDEENDLYSAAFDDVIYRDSTDDGVEADMIESGGDGVTDFELELEARRISDRLAFQVALAQLWKRATLRKTLPGEEEDRRVRLTEWLHSAINCRGRLLELLAAVANHRIPQPTGTHDSLLEYDRRRVIKESLLERIIAASVSMSEAMQFLLAAGAKFDEARFVDLHLSPGQGEVAKLLKAALLEDVKGVRQLWTALRVAMIDQPLLYVPLAKGGDPERIVAARTMQRSFRLLLQLLPRLGLLDETCQLIEIAAFMEREHPVGPGAVTEFDHLFRIGYQAIVECMVASSESWSAATADDAQDLTAGDAELVDFLQQLSEALLVHWLAHSRTLRLSVLEKLNDEEQWNELVSFVQRYGRDLFNQRFMNLGNLRAILHRGVEVWIDSLLEDPGEFGELRLLEDLEAGLSKQHACRQLTIVLEAIIENYGEYRDYNSTTTQSDRGDLLFTLLDMLRLRVRYDRIDWNLTPVMLAHEMLVRRGHTEAAELWRRTLAERTHDVADQLLDQLTALQHQYGMRLPTVADRLGERFERPLAIDRVRALVMPAMEQLRDEQPPTAFEQLEQEVDELTQMPSGVGFELPEWLEAFEEEVENSRWDVYFGGRQVEVSTYLTQTRLSSDEVAEQLEKLLERQAPRK